ncbi:DsbA family protein [Streptomyces piniterrae]|uniref:DsbA family protein n=1 Tax=Streptomyces piniterrae TaxID=2571125 RepID=A0A4U0NJ66_9ACTN|nr:DsbA family protein [Streptomyces piniterrae]TJZ54230.1 DsbA family protein [Streptomyces piniterrae]
MSSAKRTQLTYVFDAYCGWCYGFGPALHEFAAANAERSDLRVLSGGLFTGPRALPVSAYPHIPGANARISELTGVTFGPAYGRVLAEGTLVMDSADAATGLVALRNQPGTSALAAAAAMQRAWYIDGRSLSDAQVYRDIAAELGLDAEAVVAAYESPTTRAQAEADFREVRRLGVEGYPTLLLHTAHGTDRLGGPLSTSDALTRALDQHSAVMAT